MSKTLKIRFKLLQDVIINDISGNASTQKILDFIPGSSVRGEFIGKLNNQNVNQETIKQVLDSVIFSNLYLHKNSVKFFPTPASFIADKHALKAKDYSKVLNSLIYDFDAHKNDETKVQGDSVSSKKPYFSADKQMLSGVEIANHQRISLNTKSKHGSRVFYQSGIKRGQVFEGSVTFPEELSDVVNNIFAVNSVLNFGQAKTVGFGACEIINVENIDQNVETNVQSPSNELIIYLISDMICLDENGKCASSIPEKYIEEQLGISNVKLEKQVLTQKTNGGYNSTYKCGYPRWTQICKGSVFKYSFSGVLTAENVAKFQNSPIGLRFQEGYGKVLVNPKFLQKEKLSFQNESKQTGGDIS